MEVNFFAAAEMTRAVLPAMRAQTNGHILQLTSIGGLVSIGGFGPYCASKFALEGWSEALRDEIKPLGIRVTIVEPGAFRTEFAGPANIRPALRLETYRPVIEQLEAYLYGGDGKQPGDPAKAADAMIAVVESDDPPLRLLLGRRRDRHYGNRSTQSSRRSSAAGGKSGRRPPLKTPRRRRSAAETQPAAVPARAGMISGSVTADTLYRMVARHHGVTLDAARGRGFGSNALKADGRIFAALSMVACS